MGIPSGIVELLGSLLAIGLVIALLRWTFGTNKTHPSPPSDDPDDPMGVGLLEQVSEAPTESAAQVLLGRLRAAGIRATIARPTEDAPGYRVLVFPQDAVTARLVLR
ncbi:MAG: hypothetical protein OJJ54_18175 [Pseudonocardia sp.]|nr:hypothetical protein [Pseudonocardia sp.]